VQHTVKTKKTSEASGVKRKMFKTYSRVLGRQQAIHSYNHHGSGVVDKNPQEPGVVARSEGSRFEASPGKQFLSPYPEKKKKNHKKGLVE
jgi:hypothetical protein